MMQLISSINQAVLRASWINVQINDSLVLGQVMVIDDMRSELSKLCEENTNLRRALEEMTESCRDLQDQVNTATRMSASNNPNPIPNPNTNPNPNPNPNLNLSNLITTDPDLRSNHVQAAESAKLKVDPLKPNNELPSLLIFN